MSHLSLLPDLRSHAPSLASRTGPSLAEASTQKTDHCLAKKETWQLVETELMNSKSSGASMFQELESAWLLQVVTD